MTEAELKCRGCNQTLTPENDSEAHVVPNALGGHLRPKGIICRTCNSKLDDLADNALIEAFGDWPTFLDIPRDRGNQPSKRVRTRDGHKVQVERDGKMMRTDVVYDVEAIEDGHKVQIEAGDMTTFKELLKRAAKQFDKFDANEAIKYAKTVGIEDDDPLKMNLNFSPAAVFGGVVTAVWLYLIYTTGRAFMDWPKLVSMIGDVQKHGGPWRYMIDGLPGLKGPDIPIGHKVIVRCVPSTGKLIAYVEILGILKIGGVFADAGHPVDGLLEHIHAYDVFARKDRSDEFSIDPTKFEKMDWETVGLGIADAEKLKVHIVDSAENVFGKQYRERFATS